MKVGDVMTGNVFTVTPETRLEVAANRMLEYGVSGLPVVDDGRVVGVLSETDILYKECARQPERDGLVDWIAHYPDDPPRGKLDARTVGQAMTTPAVTVAPERSLADAAALMLELGIDRLPVVSGGFLVGILTRTDVVRAFAAAACDIRVAAGAGA